MRELVDSSSLLREPDTLRHRFSEDGYVFLRGLMDVAALEEVHRRVNKILARHGWVDDTNGTGRVIGRPDGRDDYNRAYRDIQALEAMHRAAHQPELVTAAEAVLGDPAFCHPGKFVRLGFPQPFRLIEPNQEYLIAQSSVRMITSWIPLAPCPPEAGGIAVLSGSHREGLRKPDLPMTPPFFFHVEDDDPRWTSASFEAGDVLMFHSLTVNASMPQQSGEASLALELRHQSVSRPLRSALALPHMFPILPNWSVLTEGWSSRQWVELPLGVEVRTVPRESDFERIEFQLMLEEARERP